MSNLKDADEGGQADAARIRRTIQAMLEVDRSLTIGDEDCSGITKSDPASGDNLCANQTSVLSKGLKVDTAFPGWNIDSPPSGSDLGESTSLDDEGKAALKSAENVVGKCATVKSDEAIAAKSAQVDPVETEESGNDLWMKLGLAALGVVVGGVVLSMQGGGETGRTHRDSDDGQERRNASTVQIEQLSDDGEDEWLTVRTTDAEASVISEQ